MKKPTPALAPPAPTGLIALGNRPEIALVPHSSLHPAPWNPRTISDERFENLCRAIQADPAFLWSRPVLANAAGEIFAGNMRFRAAQHLGLEEIPAVLDDYFGEEANPFADIAVDL